MSVEQRTYSASELAERLGLSPSYVRQQVSSGRWPGMRFGRTYRFTQEDVTQIEEAARMAPSPHRLNPDLVRHAFRTRRSRT